VDYKKHPEYRDLRISSDGSILEWQGRNLEIKDRLQQNGKLFKMVRFNGSQYSVPKLILETWGDPKPDDGRYYALHKDGNEENIHPNNLYWSKSHQIKPDRKFKNSLNLSKLSVDQTYEAYRRHEVKGEPYPKIAKDYNVSDMSVYRAVQRLKQKIQEK
jgi:hypothetical protein